MLTPNEVRDASHATEHSERVKLANSHEEARWLLQECEKQLRALEAEILRLRIDILAALEE